MSIIFGSNIGKVNGPVLVHRGNPFLRVGGAKILEPTRVSRIWRVSVIERLFAFAFCAKGKRRRGAHHNQQYSNNSILVWWIASGLTGELKYLSYIQAVSPKLSR